MRKSSVHEKAILVLGPLRCISPKSRRFSSNSCTMEKVNSDKEEISSCEKESQDIEQIVDVKIQVKEEDLLDIQALDLGKEKEKIPEEKNASEEEEETFDDQKKPQLESPSEVKSDDITEESKSGEIEGEKISDYVEDEEEPVFDGTEVPGMEGSRSLSSRSTDTDSNTKESAWPDKAVALSHYVKQKSIGAVSTVFRRLSGKSDDGLDVVSDKECTNEDKEFMPESVGQKVSKSAEKSGWNPLSLISRESKSENEDLEEDLTRNMKGRIILYTKLRCEECKEARRYLQRKELKYVEINIDVYPSRKLELEKISGSSSVPRVFFNEILIGGLSELRKLEDSGKLGEKIEYVFSEEPSYEAPLPPLSGEDDFSTGGAIDELALIVRKMKGAVCVKDRFYKMRRYTNCFLGREATDFLSEDQYLEREEAVEFGRKLVDKLFFQHVANENVFEDGNHVYRFLDDDPTISRCQNIPRGIIEVKPKPILEISSRLRLLLYAILEAYTSEDGKHVDYMSIRSSEEFARYLRIVEELQRAELHEMSREEKLSFFINLYNMMAIHAILALGPPSGPLDRRAFLGDFKYVIGGSAYSLSAIYNGVLRANQRPPYNLVKPFGAKDKRLKVALPYVEPLVHFALVCGTRSGPSLRCYTPRNIDKELMDAACSFLRNGGLYVDLVTNVAYPSKILKWYSVDFGKNEVEVLKHAANYMELADSQALLDLLSNTQLKVIYQNYDWGLNN